MNDAGRAIRRLSVDPEPIEGHQIRPLLMDGQRCSLLTPGAADHVAAHLDELYAALARDAQVQKIVRRRVADDWRVAAIAALYPEVETDTEDVPAAEALGRLLPDGREITHCHTVLGRVIEMRCASGGPSVPINDDGTVTVLVGPNTSL